MERNADGVQEDLAEDPPRQASGSPHQLVLYLRDLEAVDREVQAERELSTRTNLQGQGPERRCDLHLPVSVNQRNLQLLREDPGVDRGGVPRASISHHRPRELREVPSTLESNPGPPVLA